jgi:hypothetical protein
MAKSFLASSIAPVCISFSFIDFLSTFLVLVEIECIDCELRIPSRLREGKDVPGISFWQFTTADFPWRHSVVRFSGLGNLLKYSQYSYLCPPLPAYQLTPSPTEIEHIISIVNKVFTVPFPDHFEQLPKFLAYHLEIRLGVNKVDNGILFSEL